MRFKSVALRNFRSFVSTGHIELGNINILIGANNSGKSSIIKALHLIQNGALHPYPDVRYGETTAEVIIRFDSVRTLKAWRRDKYSPGGSVGINIQTDDCKSGRNEFKHHL